MAELINLRNARKQARRRLHDQQAGAKRAAFGQPENLRKIEETKKSKASHDLDLHRIEPGDGR